MRGSQAQQRASPVTFAMHSIFTVQPPSLFGRADLTPSAFLSCFKCRGAGDIFFKCGICAKLTARLIEGTIKIPAEHSIKTISTELRKICTMDCNGFLAAVLVYHVQTPLSK